MSIALGLDIGTSKIAAVIYDSANKEILATSIFPTKAEIEIDGIKREQDVGKIVSALKQCINELPQALRKRVESVGVTGQMHGLVLWNQDTGSTSNLITWQDGRCNEDHFLKNLATDVDYQKLRSGYGCATLAWFAKNEASLLKQFTNASTIMDLIVAQMCGEPIGVIDPTNAASWGLFDIRKNRWQEDKIKNIGIPIALLPKIEKSGAVAGELSWEYAASCGLPARMPITVSVGDNQASLMATIENPDKDLSLTLGTGGQLSVIIDDIPGEFEDYGSFEIRPYFDGKYAAVAASLCGGYAFKVYAQFIHKALKAFNITDIKEAQVYEKLDTLGLEALDSDLTSSTSFLGERNEPGKRGQIGNISPENFTPENLAASFAKSTLENLRSMIPESLWRDKKQVIGSGNGLRRLRLFQELVPVVFNLPFVLAGDREEAATGAAILASKSAN